MTLLDAIQAAASGKTVVSCVGKRYTPDMLAPIWTSNQCAAYTTAGMTKEEREGAWSLASYYNTKGTRLLSTLQ